MTADASLWPERIRYENRIRRWSHGCNGKRERFPRCRSALGDIHKEAISIVWGTTMT